MTDQPWETEPDRLDFEAEGLSCAMRRSSFGNWCGYVGVDSDHPLFGLPVNALLKLPDSWFTGRVLDQGTGPMDMVLHAISDNVGKGVYPISLAFHVHGGISYANGYIKNPPDWRWWFGFDCGHSGDYLPYMAQANTILTEMVDAMPEKIRETMRRIALRPGLYRDQQYVVSECQSLAAQLVAIVAVLEKVVES